MPSVDFQRVEALFFEARALPPAERDAFLDRACAGDAALRAEVAGLLRHDSGDPAGGTPSSDDAATFIRPAGADDDDDAGDPLAPPKARVGPYECGRVIGRGGMGVVYRARDTRLDRCVAIKTLPPQYHDHPERLARFTREARLLASLSHPGIATVFGLEDDGTTIYLVMEFIDGHTLAERLARGPLSIEESLRICLKIAEAVEAAHTADVVHRDLKPGNVMLADDGAVKVLDFGLARELPAADAPARGASGGPKTRDGVAIGTPGYMSPEQARGQNVDRRTDVFALGCVLYECLTGQAAFAATTHADAVAHVLDREPDYDALPRRTPGSVRRLLRRCLAKQTSQRMRDMGDIALELESALAEREWSSPSVPAARGGGAAAAAAAVAPTWLTRAARVLVPVAALAAIAAAVVALVRPTPARTAALEPVRRFSLTFPGRAAQSDLARVRVALSRDGAKMALSAAAADASGQHGLWVRDNGQYDFAPVDGARDAWLPRFSPDGDWLAYTDGAALLKRRPTGGSPVKLADLGGAWGEFAWSADGSVAFVRARNKGLARVSDRGGATPTPLTTPAAGEVAHLNPCLLPDGSAVLYTSWDGRGELRIDAKHLGTGATTRVVENATSPKVAATAHGTYLLYARAGTVFAAPFDPKALKRTGPETAIADGVMTHRALFAACYDAADDGSLVYVPGPTFEEESRLAWYDPVGRGNPFPFNDDREPFVEPHFSRDGMKLSVVLKGEVSRPFLYDLERQTFARVVIDGDCTSAAVSPDGTKLAYGSNRGGSYAVYVRDLATGADERLIDETRETPVQIRWSPDGKALAFAMPPVGQANRDVWVVDLASRQTTAFCAGDGEDRAPRFSPDGRWVAYASDATGTRQVYVKRFPDASPPRQISDAGGDWPEWSLDGSRIYYRTRGGGLYAVGVSPEDGSITGRPTLVYARRFGQSDPDLPDYTLAPDGRLLLVEPSERGPTVSHVNVVLDWPSLLPPSARRP